MHGPALDRAAQQRREQDAAAAAAAEEEEEEEEAEVEEDAEVEASQEEEEEEGDQAMEEAESADATEPTEPSQANSPEGSAERGEAEQPTKRQRRDDPESGASRPPSSVGSAYDDANPARRAAAEKLAAAKGLPPGWLAFRTPDSHYKIVAPDRTCYSRLGDAKAVAEGHPPKPPRQPRPSQGAALHPAAAAAASAAAAAAAAGRRFTPLRTGMKVAAKYGGGAKYYPGVITRDNGDDTYAIKYDDGDTEDAVKRPLIRTEEPIWSEGHSVEVREAGTGRYLLGVITRHNRGTFDVDFGDGRVERRVGPERMREPPARESGPEGVGGEEGAASPTAKVGGASGLSEVDSPSQSETGLESAGSGREDVEGDQ